ncbi:hypothetical protein MM1S1540310_4793 [Mycobacteroides abscessus subsp. bolletii 1S-154-0310]|nr:hypothetical protein MM1S1510930_5237 [Mycobacteroides abscessus subsp. bolletii 1S-151-0930]EIU71980.1 hypothetical protein MM1S1530915_4787 [Mycobacteroides abscessus subsp. bolletii 1S-153-0915]EIU75694.1 hypothetical protein MM1S1540310_4793 [Mycobacteroides abscessus subsp. bolletii 1S-154-0310]BAP95045.1 hypothetical protein MMASJCM_0269 [Mycobacteroides abscessus subsp. massiliense CCUG 48898 = JCM 15300]
MCADVAVALLPRGVRPPRRGGRRDVNENLHKQDRRPLS